MSVCVRLSRVSVISRIPQTAGGVQAELVAELLRAAREPGGVPKEEVDTEGGLGSGMEQGSGLGGNSGSAPGSRASVASAVFEEVEVLEDCYGVRRFVRAYRL